VISLYMEHTRRPREFLEKAREVSKKKPILCLKAGRSAEAADAMASHTGSLAGDDGLYDALISQSGIVRVNEYEDLWDCAKVFSRGILPAGNRLGVITLTGAIGIQCIDLGAAAGLVPGPLTRPSREKLADISPTLGGHPIDLGPASAIDGPSLFGHYIRCVDILMNDPQVDCIYVNLYIGSYMVPELYADVLAHIEKNMRKPVVMWTYGPDRNTLHALNALGERHGIPAYATTGKAIRSLGYLARYAQWRERFL
jgi:acyl-CoA synthetase (NDP forming)